MDILLDGNSDLQPPGQDDTSQMVPKFQVPAPYEVYPDFPASVRFLSLVDVKKGQKGSRPHGLEIIWLSSQSHADSGHEQDRRDWLHQSLLYFPGLGPSCTSHAAAKGQQRPIVLQAVRRVWPRMISGLSCPCRSNVWALHGRNRGPKKQRPDVRRCQKMR
jgi:hypothetical protein